MIVVFSHGVFREFYTAFIHTGMQFKSLTEETLFILAMRGRRLKMTLSGFLNTVSADSQAE